MINEVDLVSALNGLVSNRVFPDVADYHTATPFITFQQVGGAALNYLEGVAPAQKPVRIQISVWADTRLQAMQLIRKVQDLVVQPPLLATTEGAAIAYYDNETKLRAAHQDFSFLFT